VIVLCALAACGNGQTGSIEERPATPPSSVTVLCPVMQRAIDFDERVVFASGTEITASELRDKLRLTLEQSMMLEWDTLDFVLGDTPVPLSVTDFALSAPQIEEGFSGSALCGDRKLIAATSLHLHTDDGLFDADVNATATVWGSAVPKASQWAGTGLVWEGTAAVRMDPALLAKLESRSIDVRDPWKVLLFTSPGSAGQLGLSVTLGPSLPIAGAATAYRNAHDYPAPAEFTSICNTAEPTAVRRFARQEEFVAAISKRWIRCAGHTGSDPDHDGIEVIDGRTWKHLAAKDGALVEQAGFEHEGEVELGEGYASGTYRMTIHHAVGPGFINGPGFIEGVTRELSASGNTLRFASEGELSDFVYVATDLPVASSRSSYSDGTRAGSTACQDSQTDVHQHFATADELRALLLGTWSFCGNTRLGTDASATAIVFDPDGHYRYLDQAGQVLFSSMFEILPAQDLGIGFYVRLADPRGAYGIWPWISDAPRMLWPNSGASLLSAEP
jgi:hypothetical protein